MKYYGNTYNHFYLQNHEFDPFYREKWSKKINPKSAIFFFKYFILDFHYPFLGGQMPDWLQNSGTGVYKRSGPARPAGYGFNEDAIKNAFFGKL